MEVRVLGSKQHVNNVVSLMAFKSQEKKSRSADFLEMGAKLKKIRVSRSWSQKRIAEAMGVHQQTYWKYEAGEREPSAGMLKRLIQNDNTISADWLLLGSEPETEISQSGATSAQPPGEGMAKHINWLESWIDRLSDEIASSKQGTGPFAGDQEVTQAVNSLDQGDYNTIRDLILGFAWWARRYGTQETEPDKTKKKQSVRV